jgi:molecular chaperone HtpG
LLEQFAEVEANEEHKDFEKKAGELLKRFGCICKLKHFTPADTPVIFVAEEKETNTKAANNSRTGNNQPSKADTTYTDIQCRQ